MWAGDLIPDQHGRNEKSGTTPGSCTIRSWRKLTAHGWAGEKKPPPNADRRQNRNQYLGNGATNVVRVIDSSVAVRGLRMVEN
jgi:hypothetical protein